MAINLRKAHIYTAIINNSNAQVKAYSKESAFDYFKSLDKSIQYNQVFKTTIKNSHQTPINQVN